MTVVKRMSRRLFLLFALVGIAFSYRLLLGKRSNASGRPGMGNPRVVHLKGVKGYDPTGGGEDRKRGGRNATIYVARNGTPQRNVAKVMEMMGGVEKFIGKKDIVILKPNAQWWNQGRTNLAAIKGFIDLVLGIPGFEGEIIIAENHHFMDESLPEGEKDNIRGWTHFSEINGDIDGVNHNLNTLIELFNKSGYRNVTKYHWRDGGPKADVWGNGQNGGIVASAAEGDGYVWTDMDYVFSGLMGLKKWKVKMTYPVFTSKYSGITIDLMNGAFERDGNGGGRYLTDRSVRLINFAVLNTHGDDTGITSSIKNYMVSPICHAAIGV